MFTSKSESVNFDSKSYFFNELSKINNPVDKSSIYSTEQNTVIQSITTNSQVTADDNNLCLITKELLHPNHITLFCGHKFNYIPLYKEIVNQKNKSNNGYEITKLDIHQIKCPYCRTVTNKLLPYIPYASVKLIKYVNCPEEHCMNATKCSHTFTRRNKSDSNSDDNTDSNNESSPPSTLSVIKEYKCDKNGIYFEMEKVLFCQHHYKLYKKKSDRGLAKDKKVNNNLEQTQCEVSDKGCKAILKTGKNTGKKCLNSTNGSLYCKRHTFALKE